jgi:hypothetical protein
MHPDVVEFEPEGNQILVAQAEAVIREAHRARSRPSTRSSPCSKPTA